MRRRLPRPILLFDAVPSNVVDAAKRLFDLIPGKPVTHCTLGVVDEWLRAARR